MHTRNPNDAAGRYRRVVCVSLGEVENREHKHQGRLYAEIGMTV